MQSIINFIKGIFIGIALVIPGLSGSLFAVVVGLYDKILMAINTLKKNFKKNVLFLLPIVLGAIVGIFGSTSAVLWVCETYTQQAYFFFIGLVLGSLPLVLRKIKKVKFNPLYLILTLLAFFIIMTITLSINEGSDEAAKSYVAIKQISGVSDVLTVFGAGVFSCSMMAIPGVSGSIMLMIINQYGTVYYAVSKCPDVIKYLIRGDWALAAESLGSVMIVIIYALGAVVGLLLIAKILTFLLKKFESLTYYAVLGLIIGAVFSLAYAGVLPDLDFSIGAGKLIGTFIIDIILVIVGIACTIFFDSPEKE